MSRHLVRRGADARYVTHADGLRQWSVVDDTTSAAVHTGFALCTLDPGGSVPARVQSFEESVFLLNGTVVLQTPEDAVALGPGDYALLPVGYPHAWRNEGGKVARWARMLAPQPRGRFGGDAHPAPLADTDPPHAIDVRDPRNRLFGHIDSSNLDPTRQTQEQLALSASMRTALLVYSGITVKMMVDSDLGAQLSTMFMVQYEPDGVAGLQRPETLDVVPLPQLESHADGEAAAFPMPFGNQRQGLVGPIPGDAAQVGPEEASHLLGHRGEDVVRGRLGRHERGNAPQRCLFLGEALEHPRVLAQRRKQAGVLGGVAVAFLMRRTLVVEEA